MVDQHNSPSPAPRSDGIVPSEKIDIENVIDPSEITALEFQERMWRELQPRRLAALLVIAGFMFTCYLLFKEGTQSPVYTLFVSLLSAALATVFGKNIDGANS